MFDLKGSTVGREATPEERERNAVMKDNDLTMDNVVMRLGKNRDVFVNTLREDALWLASHNIMDYSLLLGIHYDDHQKDERHAHRTVSVQLTDKEIDRQLKMFNDGGIRVYSEEIEEGGAEVGVRGWNEATAKATYRRPQPLVTYNLLSLVAGCSPERRK